MFLSKRCVSVGSSAIAPADCLSTGKGLACARAVSIRVVNAGTFTEFIVIEGIYIFIFGGHLFRYLTIFDVLHLYLSRYLPRKIQDCVVFVNDAGSS